MRETTQRKNLKYDLDRLYKKETGQKFRIGNSKHTKQGQFVVEIEVGKFVDDNVFEADYFGEKWIVDRKFKVVVNEETGHIII